MFPWMLLIILIAATWAQSLDDVCTVAYITASLPNSRFTGLLLDSSSVTAVPYYNITVPDQTDFPGKPGLNFCSVTFSYSHDGANDRIQLQYLLPEPSSFRGRFLATGGGGLAINSGSPSLLHGIVYSAATGLTDGGFGGFAENLLNVLLVANGTLNYRALYSFAYLGIHEMTIVGKAFVLNFYKTDKVYSYYFGCSEGGREGWSQIQRYGDQYDGVVVGAPAFRQAYQQVNHLTSNVIEKAFGYAPPPCELMMVVNDTIDACDPLDGKTDGVVSRTDLCKLHYSTNSSIGQPYHCPASSEIRVGDFVIPARPEQSGMVTSQGANIAQAINNGLIDSQGRQVYISYQPSSPYDDATTSYNTTSKQWYIQPQAFGVDYVQYFLHEVTKQPCSFDAITADTLRSYILQGLQKFAGTLQTVWPELEAFHSAGGKIIHYHGESDPSIPSGSSVLYYESVRKTMYPGLSYNASHAALDEWYRLFLIPGGGHCGPSDTRRNGLWPRTLLETVINWVEDGVEPVTLDGFALGGEKRGQMQKQQICSWPLRPLWRDGDMECVHMERDALETWFPDLNSIPIPVY